MNRLPAAVFIIDVLKEKIAVAEASKLNIMTFAMVDTNSDPNLVDFPIPSNDDASKSIDKILSIVTDAVTEGLSERKKEKEGTSDSDAKEMEAAAKKERAETIVPEAIAKSTNSEKKEESNEKEA